MPKNPNEKETKPAKAAKRKTADVLHRVVATLIASGYAPKEIAQKLGRSHGLIKNIAIREDVRALVDEEQRRQAGLMRGSVDKAIDILKAGAPKAAKRLVGIAASSPEVHAAVSAAKAVLDRSGVGPSSQHDINVHLGNATDDELWQRLRELEAKKALESTTADADPDEDYDEEADES